ncbi:CvpA family protein [Flavobacteriaceae bacterium]|nr:CvpA family protein [Flavobacteriaceae bacterium]
MSSFDIGLLVLGAFGFYKGYKNGILIELTTLLALILGFYGAQHLASYTARMLHEQFHWNPENLYLIAMGLTFICIVIGVYLLGKALTKVVSMILLGGINKILGGFFGILKIGVIISVLIAYGQQYFNVLEMLPSAVFENSVAIAHLEDFGRFLVQEVFVSENLNTIKRLFSKG